jgi:hypothetical protein
MSWKLSYATLMAKAARKVGEKSSLLSVVVIHVLCHIDTCINEASISNSMIMLSGYINSSIKLESLQLRSINGQILAQPWIYYLHNHSHLHPNDSYRWMESLWPAYGTILSGKLHYEFRFHQSMQQIELKQCDYLHFQVQGLLEQRIETKTGIVESVGNSSMEPGSWFIKISPLCEDAAVSDDATSDELVSDGYLEYVLSHEKILQERLYHSQSHGSAQQLYYYPPEATAMTNQRQSKIHVCIFGSDRMDGQKRIWLNQIQGMDPDEFTFSFILGQSMSIVDQHSNNIDRLRSILNQLTNLQLYDSPLNDLALSYEQLAQGYLEHRASGKFL